jgi:hypothetical protein
MQRIFPDDDTSPPFCDSLNCTRHRNPVSIIVPCHRVTGVDSSLTGYAGGLHIKQILFLPDNKINLYSTPNLPARKIDDSLPQIHRVCSESFFSSNNWKNGK